MDFDLIFFRKLYPAFEDAPDDIILFMSEQAKCIADVQGCQCNDLAWYALTAHLLESSKGAAKGESQFGVLASASIDKVSVSFMSFQPRTAWQAWLSGTPYGQQAMAFLAACNAGGFFVGGLPERDAFKSVYGLRGGRKCR